MYEIDYLPVGTGSKGGDAIALRYGDFSSPATQKVVIIDGGTKDSGKALVEHVKTYYGTSHVDTVVATHLHNDHISGLTEVLENLTVGKLVIHLPWDCSAVLKRMTVTQASASSIGNKLEKSLGALSSIIDIAEAKRIPIVQAFAGEQILDGLYVLGPTKDYYLSLLANFGITPEVKEGHKIEGFIGAVKDALSFIAETIHIETLSDDYPDTSPENNSSLVLLLLVDNKRFLFTGDAGKDALTRAINFAESKNVSLANIDFFDVPHHGSKRNLGPSILNHLMPKASIISCPQDGDPKHPSRKVCNALLRRNSTLHTTRSGKTLCNPCEGAPDRGWTSATPESFYNEVEE